MTATGGALLVSDLGQGAQGRRGLKLAFSAQFRRFKFAFLEMVPILSHSSEFNNATGAQGQV